MGMTLNELYVSKNIFLKFEPMTGLGDDVCPDKKKGSSFAHISDPSFLTIFFLWTNERPQNVRSLRLNPFGLHSKQLFFSVKKINNELITLYIA